jgi:hypothetical protein
MHTVEILLNQTDLRDQMSAMRVWLDERRYETSVFNYHQVLAEFFLLSDLASLRRPRRLQIASPVGWLEISARPRPGRQSSTSRTERSLQGYDGPVVPAIFASRIIRCSTSALSLAPTRPNFAHVLTEASEKTLYSPL